MIDIAAASLELRAARRNSLENIIIPKSRRSFLLGIAMLVLGSGWFAAHHLTGHLGGPTPAAASALHNSDR